MKKTTIIKAALLTFIFSIVNFVSVHAAAEEALPPELSWERLVAIIKKFGPPPKGLILWIVVLLVLIIVSIVWYKIIEAKEGKENE